MPTKPQAFNILQGDVTEQLQQLPANFFDAVLSDPPYGISFMGKAWDKGVPSAATYQELSRVLKPGAFGLHFGGTRMWHRLAVNLEDAGFELRDTVMWLYGSGFPKSHNISKALDKAAGADAAKTWDGYGTALKPAWEPALLVQKPLEKTFAYNALAWGNGGLNIDGCRVGYASEVDQAAAAAAAMRFAADQNAGRTAYGAFTNGEASRGPYLEKQSLGRFPANVILDEEAGLALDEQTGDRPAGNFPAARGISHIGFASGQATKGGARQMTDQVGASRFFYCAKVSTKERNAGLSNFADHVWAAEGACVPERERRPFNPSKNSHPTLKPIALTTYLAKLLLVPARTGGQPRRILVPFSGSGSEMIGCLLAGWDEVWGIEIDGEYVKIATARIAHHCPDAQPLERDKIAA